MVVRWILNDPAVPESYTFEYNPHDVTPLPLQKNVSSYSTCAPDGSVVFFEGRDNPQLSSLVITVVDEAQYRHLVYWYSKRRQVQLTDDLGNTSWIYFTTFQPVRKWAYQHPWRTEVTMQYYTFGVQAVVAL